MNRLLERIGSAQLASTLGGGRDDAHVYFIQRADGPIKIGASTNIVRRLAELQIGSPEPMRIIGVAVMGGFKLERGLHDLHSEDRIAGEWFNPSREVLRSVREWGLPA